MKRCATVEEYMEQAGPRCDALARLRALLRDSEREETRHRRLLKILPILLSGKGLNDRYRGS